MFKVCWLVLLALLATPAGMVWAHGTVGDYTFLEPIVADDANPEINFDNPIEQLFAKLEVLDSSDQDETAGPAKVSADHKQLSVPVKPLKPGDYTVKWGVVAEDGHHTEGWYQFTVTGGSGS